MKLAKPFAVLLVLLVLGGVVFYAARPVSDETPDREREVPTPPMPQFDDAVLERVGRECEFSSLPVSEIENIIVYLWGGPKTHSLDEDERLELVSALSSVEITGTGTLAYVDYEGMFNKMFRLELADGSSIDFAASSPFYVIDSVGYRAEYRTCHAIGLMYWELVEKYASEGYSNHQNSWQKFGGYKARMAALSSLTGVSPPASSSGPPTAARQLWRPKAA